MGFTDEAGVQLPPLHPRCRCAIIYREVGERTISGNKFTPLTPERAKAIREAEDAAFNAKTGAGFGFNRRTAQPKWAEEIRFANGTGAGLERMMNCQRCVVAHEARMRGYDVISRPSWGTGDHLQRVEDWLEVFEESSREIYNCAGKTAAELEKFIEKKMNEWGKGSRAFVWLKWENAVERDDFGHIIVTRLNENGFVQYGDPQKKKIGAVRYLNEVKAGSIVMMRADTLEFTDLVKRCCMNRR